MSELDAEDLLDAEVAGYHLTKRLGGGGMAVVYRGQSTLRARIVRAIKVVRKELASRPEFRERFAEEAEVLEQLEHPNIVKFYGVRQEKGLLIMELELLEGLPLSRVGEQGAGKLDVNRAAGWLLQAAEGVAKAHDMGFVHRDLKPDNLFLSRDGRVKVLDFGIARAVDEADRQTKITGMGERAPGSPAYMAPEVCQGATPTVASDVYALGLTLYELLLGYHPFEPPDQGKKTQLQLMQAQVAAPLPRLDELRPDVPKGLADVAAWATAKDPQQRAQTARQLVDALRGAVGILPETDAGLPSAPEGQLTSFELPEFVAGTPAGVVTAPMGASEKKNPPWIPIGLGAFAVVVTGGLVASQMGGGDQTGTAAAQVAAADEPEREEPKPDVAPELPYLANPFVLIEPKQTYSRDPVYLGVHDRSAGKEQELGFRKSRKAVPPINPYEIQQHEVTIGEYEYWAEQAGKTYERVGDPDSASYPATGVLWDDALEFCKQLGGSLPTEEQWEYAARGAEMRPYAWGQQPLDTHRVTVFEGPDGGLAEVMTSDQDRTPGAENQVLWDMMGNAQEWTADVYRDSFRASDDATHLMAGPSSFRAIRGLPLRGTKPPQLIEGAAWREKICVTDRCKDLEPIRKKREELGFRCVRAPREDK